MLWLAQLGSLIGTWMQTVGAQWLLVDQPAAETLVALVQTANMSPVFFLALPAGVFADVFDRRRLLMAVQTAALLVAGALAALTAAGKTTPALLLTFTFLLGCAQTLTMPAWQALIPELVPRSQLPAASALGGISMNLARAVGPAVAGVLIASVDVAAVFALNALSFGFLVLALATWRRRPVEPDDHPERFGSALRGRRPLHPALAGGPPHPAALAAVRRARHRGLGAAGPGRQPTPRARPRRLRAAAGRPRRRCRHRRLHPAPAAGAGPRPTASSCWPAWSTPPPCWWSRWSPTRPSSPSLLFAAGAAWLAVLANLNAAMQLFLPGWVRARGLSTYQIVFVGGQGVAALVWGLLAERFGLVAVFLAAAGLMLAGAASLRWWPLHDTEGLDREPGDVLARAPSRLRARARRRPGAGHRHLPGPRGARAGVPRGDGARSAVRASAPAPPGGTCTRTGPTADQFVETFVVPSWAEHLRQHGERLTGTDQALEERAIALADGPPEVRHLFSVQPRP